MIKIKEIPPWFLDKYEATPDGKIFSRNFTGKTGQKRELKPVKNSDGYLRISLYTAYRQRTHFAVHRIIGVLFVPNPQGFKFINHKNGIKSDNRAVNLEWTDHSGNLRHAYKLGLRGRRKSKRFADMPAVKGGIMRI